MNGTPLSVVLITRDEEANIARCLESVRWAHEVVVVDSGSTDHTVEICQSLSCRVIQTAWKGFGLTKRYAVEQASHDWILSVDADEVVTPELTHAIRFLLDGEPQAAAYRIRRRSCYLGTPIRFSGWQHDRPIRLFDRRRGTFNDRSLHESVVVDGPVETVRSGDLLHYPYPTVSSHLAKMERYSALGAQRLFTQGQSASIPEAVARGTAKFIKMFFLRGGFLDGKVGFVLAENSAFGVYLKYLKLWELSRRRRST
ncbi:glycosyltransferase family 2 protein [Candidatus Fermentibacteria bacterium]|nr:glycosyltransferase family 2 protein [Candidatus Fermentibacteria bacterium]